MQLFRPWRCSSGKLWFGPDNVKLSRNEHNLHKLASANWEILRMLGAIGETSMMLGNHNGCRLRKIPPLINDVQTNTVNMRQTNLLLVSGKVMSCNRKFEWASEDFSQFSNILDPFWKTDEHAIQAKFYIKASEKINPEALLINKDWLTASPNIQI